MTLEGPILANEVDGLVSAVRSEFMQANWSPAARLVAAALGGGLVIYGLRAQGPLAKATATFGTGIVVRGVSNKEVGSWTYLGAARQALGL